MRTRSFRRWLLPGVLLLPLAIGCDQSTAPATSDDAGDGADVLATDDVVIPKDVQSAQDTPAEDAPATTDVPVAADAMVKPDVPVEADAAVEVDVVIEADAAIGNDVVTEADAAVGTDVVTEADAPAAMDVQPAMDVPIATDVPAAQDVVTTDVPRTDVAATDVGATAPANDTRANATAIDLSAPTQTLMANNSNARNDTAGPTACISRCGGATQQRDVFYRFTLAAPTVVYADTFGASFDTLLFLQDERGMNLTAANGAVTCSDDTCSTLQSQVHARLAAGTYFLVVSGCRNTAGAIPVRFQHTAAGAASTQVVDPASNTARTVTGTLTAGASRVTAADGAEDLVYFATCPSFRATRMSATTCGTNTQFDSVLAVRRPGGTAVPSDTDDDTCGLLSTVTTTIPTGPGLHALYVDAKGATAAGAWSVNVRFGAGCATGLTECRGTCVSTQFESDECGACGRACMTGQQCAAGRCVAVPANDSCASATAITLGAAGALTAVTGTTAGASHLANTAHCSRVGRDVYWRFTLTQREYVYADTFGSEGDTQVGFLSACDGAATACVDDTCGGAHAQTAAALDPGTYYVVVTTYNANDGGAVRLTLQHRPISGPVAAAPARGTYTLDGTTVGGSPRVAACPAGMGRMPSPERIYTWLSCPGSSGVLTADSCDLMTTFDSVIQYQGTAGNAGNAACNDDQGSTTCRGAPNRSAIRTAVVAGAGAHILTVGGYNGASGAFRVAGSRP